MMSSSKCSVQNKAYALVHHDNFRCAISIAKMMEPFERFSTYFSNLFGHLRSIVANNRSRPVKSTGNRRSAKPKQEEPVILTLSSDEEDESNEDSRVRKRLEVARKVDGR